MNRSKELAGELYEAKATGQPIEPITSRYPDLGPADAYAIQQEFVELLRGPSDTVVGYKLGLTSKPMQDMLGVSEPDYGPVLSSMVLDDGAAMDFGELIAPKAEAEIGLVLGSSLHGPNVTRDEAAAALSGAVAAIEIVDSRIENWNIKLVDTIADLASSAMFISNIDVVPLDFDVRLCGMVIAKNGETQATGAGAAALGDPIYAVSWLANTLAGYGVSLEAGHVIMTGALHAAFDVTAGDAVTAAFDRLGTVSVSFEGTAAAG